MIDEKCFLAMTALEDFWDSSKPMLFLGPWCLMHDRRSYWKSLNRNLLDSPFESASEAHLAYIHVNEVYEHILPILANALNSIHGQNYSIRYWRIVLGPWLLFYLPVIYDRYEHLRRALEQYPDLTTTVLSEDCFMLPLNSLDFVARLSDDLFNLQIYSKIFLFLGKKYPSKKALFEQNSLYKRLIRRSWKQRLLGAVATLHKNVASIFFASTTIVFKNTYFPKSSQVRLLLSFYGRGILAKSLDSKIPEHQYDPDMRKALKGIYLGDDAFFKCLSDMLFSDIPKCFVEDFRSACETGKEQYPGLVKAIFSANAWWFDEVFKFWAAASAEKGTLLLGTTHSGGASGSRLDLHSVKHETAIVDYYYSSGWEREGCLAEVIPMPEVKLIGRKKIGASNIKKGILWGTTSAPRYLVQFWYLPPILFQNYLHWHKRFSEALLSNLLLEICVRPHYQDNGWNIVSRLTESIPGLKVDSWDSPFIESLDKCRLYVCDHFSTTFAEALAANKPTILFWDPKANELRPEAEQYFDLLRSNGILFDSPEAAAEAVNHVYDDVESWWDDPGRQKAVRSFCERFARTSPDAIALWSNELKKVWRKN